MQKSVRSKKKLNPGTFLYLKVSLYIEGYGGSLNKIIIKMKGNEI